MVARVAAAAKTLSPVRLKTKTGKSNPRILNPFAPDIKGIDSLEKFMKRIESRNGSIIFKFFLHSDLKPCRSYNIDTERVRYKLNIMRKSRLRPEVLQPSSTSRTCCHTVAACRLAILPCTRVLLATLDYHNYKLQPALKCRSYGL